ncbi:MAG: hypothetical protein BWY74_03035 [Firmicutes bacterium ADurb.Bin419]|nr:MAG: hypothetical protein BWY74_03035 [Firmicutes bacterium ADurb.Bin419]
MRELIKKNKGFSLIELLIVIAIIGVISVIAFSMFTGVLQNSRKKADDRHALLIEKAVLAYMLESEDFSLQYLTFGSQSLNAKDNLTPSEDLIYALQHTITCIKDGKSNKIYPILNPISGTAPSTSSYAPQWNNSVGGKYVGYKIEVFPKNANCTVTLVSETDDAYVIIIE